MVDVLDIEFNAGKRARNAVTTKGDENEYLVEKYCFPNVHDSKTICSL